MPNHNGDGMQILVRRDQVTKDEWIKLINARKALIEPLMDKVSLKTLGDSWVSREGGFKIREASFKTFSLEFNNPLGLQGFFAEKGSIPTEELEKRIYGLWGITRSGVWVLVLMVSHLENHRFEMREISVLRSTPKKIMEELGISAKEVWDQLGIFVKNAVKERERLLDEIKNIKDIILAEDAVLSLIPK